MRNVLILIAGLCIISCSQSKKENSEPQSITSALPAFLMTLTTGEKLLTNKLPGNVILVFYNPACNHCQREAAAIRKELTAFHRYTIYFIAASPVDEIKKFANDYDLAGYPNIIFAQAEIPDVIREMGPMGTPALFIYSSDKQLVRKFDGETNIEEIVKYL